MLTPTVLVIVAFLAVVEGKMAAPAGDRVTRVPDADKVKHLPDGRVKCFKANQVARAIRRAVKDGEAKPDGTRPIKATIGADFEKDAERLQAIKDKFAEEKAAIQKRIDDAKSEAAERRTKFEAEQKKRVEAADKAREAIVNTCATNRPGEDATDEAKARYASLCVKGVCGRELPDDAPEEVKTRYEQFCKKANNPEKRAENKCAECKEACPKFTDACVACIRERNAAAEVKKDGEQVLKQLATIRSICGEQEKEEDDSREARCSLQAFKDLNMEDRVALRADCNAEKEALAKEIIAKQRAQQAEVAERVAEARKKAAEIRERQVEAQKERIEAAREKLAELKANADAQKERADALKCNEESTEEEKEACKKAREAYIALKKAELGDDLTDKAKCFRRHRRRLKLKLGRIVACADSDEDAEDAVYAVLAARFEKFCENHKENKFCTGADRERLQEFAIKVTNRVEAFLDESESDLVDNLKCREDADVVVDVADPASNNLVLDGADRKREMEDLIDTMTDALGEDEDVLGMEIADEPVDNEPLEEVIFLDDATAEVDDAAPAGTDPVVDDTTTEANPNATNPKATDDGSSASSLMVSALMGVAVFAALL